MSADELSTLANRLEELIAQAERSSQTIENHLARLIRHLSDNEKHARCWWDYQGRFIYVNQRFADMLGMEKSEFIDQSFLPDDQNKAGRIHPDDISHSLSEYNRNTKKGYSISADFVNRYIHADGSVVWFLWEYGWNDTEMMIGSGEVTIATPERIEFEIKSRNLKNPFEA